MFGVARLTPNPSRVCFSDEVTVVFSDIVGFTDISKTTSPLKVSQMLDRLYLAFDRLAREHGVFKVETIGE